MQQRILETEVMKGASEVLAYDRLVRRYMYILHAGFVETIMNNSPPSGYYLEVGTGTGWISIGVANLSQSVRICAADLSLDMIKLAQQNTEKKKLSGRIKFLLADAKCLPFPDGFFDASYSHNMLHHLPDPVPLLREMIRVTKPEGAIIIRDLVRLPRYKVPFHVHLFGLPYSKEMRAQYRNSILAAFSVAEWRALPKVAGAGKDFHFTREFVTHQTMIRPSKEQRAQYLEVPVPSFLRPLKNLYVTRLTD